jgi:transposase
MRRRLDLFPTHGQPAFAPWRLALVTVFQFMENVTDRQAADAVRDRLAWKYALSLELTDPGFDHSVLSEFRSRLLEGHAEERMPGSPPGAMSGGRMAEAPEDDNGPTKPMYSASIRALNRTLRVAQTMVSVLHVRVAR